jgi:hypothetical protein
VISDAPLDADTVADLGFSYSQQFKYRWTDKFLSTGLFDITPGETSVFSIGGQEYAVLVPQQGEGVRGVIIADPCFTNEFVWCSFGEKLDTFNRTIALLNAINGHSDVHFWSVLGVSQAVSHPMHPSTPPHHTSLHTHTTHPSTHHTSLHTTYIYIISRVRSLLRSHASEHDMFSVLLVD